MPASGPANRAAVKPTAMTARNPATAEGNRAVHSSTPSASNVAAPSQYCSGGFSKYLRSLSLGVTQSPLTAISRAISA